MPGHDELYCNAPGRRDDASIAKSFPTILCRWRRAILGRRRIGFLLLILGRFLLCRLQVVNDLLQGGDGTFQTLDLPVGGIQLLLMVKPKLRDRLLQEIDVALPAPTPPPPPLLYVPH